MPRDVAIIFRDLVGKLDVLWSATSAADAGAINLTVSSNATALAPSCSTLSPKRTARARLPRTRMTPAAPGARTFQRWCEAVRCQRSRHLRHSFFLHRRGRSSARLAAPCAQCRSRLADCATLVRRPPAPAAPRNLPPGRTWWAPTRSGVVAVLPDSPAAFINCVETAIAGIAHRLVPTANSTKQQTLQ